MRFEGRIFKEGKLWAVEIPAIDGSTQGRTRAEAFRMAADLVETMANRQGFKASIYEGENDSFEVGSDDAAAMIALLLRRRREVAGKSLAEAAAAVGSKSKNTYARYEQGKSVPSVAKLDELLRALGQTLVVAGVKAKS